MLNALKNKIICFLVHHTDISVEVCYEVIKQVSETEMKHLYKIIKKD